MNDLNALDDIVECTGYELNVPINAGSLRDRLAADRALRDELRSLIDELRFKPWHHSPNSVAEHLEYLLSYFPHQTLTDRQLAARAFANPSDPVAYAEMQSRGLVQPDLTCEAIYRIIEDRERGEGP